MHCVAFEQGSSEGGAVRASPRVFVPSIGPPWMLPPLAIGLLLAGGIDATFLGLSRCGGRGKHGRPKSAVASSDDEEPFEIEMDTFQPVTQSVCASKRKLRRFSRLRGVFGKGRRGRRRAKAETEMEEDLAPLPSAYKLYDW